MKIKFLNPANAHIQFDAGDEIHVSRLSPAIESLLASVRIDGQRVAQIIEDPESDEEIADSVSDLELAVTGKSRTRGRRSSALSS